MARLSREKKREQQQAAHTTHGAAEPIEVRIPAHGAGDAVASVGGVPVTVAPGEEVQQAVLDRLQHLARAAGHAVLATVRDERIGFVVPLRVEPDGSSRFTADPVPTGPSTAPAPAAPAPTSTPAPVSTPTEQARPAPPAAPFAPPVPSAPPQAPAPDAVAARNAVVRPPAPLPVGDTGRAVPFGTVAPPTGTFGPPPVMEAKPHPVVADEGPRRAAGTSPHRSPDPDDRPAPPRGFDAVAEAVLGDGSEFPGPTAGGLLAEPVARISDAVRHGRLDPAARLAEETVTEATATLGAEHPEVLRVRELGAYVAYLAGHPEPALRTCLDVAALRRRAGDAEAAYSSVRGAATAWRAVRDPLRGLELGRELLALWTELAADGGPAGAETDALESARARMDRLHTRARTRQD
ncbi:tetratricopeptide repeat protein [Streptomyces sp. bgisy022]|uniref:tetratricopeptide repeat protein n=1 Tax=Streptomyces sp. bgisy022 TaxID=3413769 RepID=UPI003D71BD46